MSAREEILEWVRKALGRPAGARAPAPESVVSPRPKLEGVMPPIAPESLVPKFEEEFTKVSGRAYRVTTEVEFEQVLRQILETSQAKTAFLSRNRLLGDLKVREKLGAWGKTVLAWPSLEQAALPTAQAFSAEVGITGLDFVLAETGSLVVTSQTEGSQLASLAPPVHIALYRRAQVVASLDEVLERLPVPRDAHVPAPGRSVVFITGPSRTADIEQILIRGVHGPREVHAILVEEACFA